MMTLFEIEKASHCQIIDPYLERGQLHQKC